MDSKVTCIICPIRCELITQHEDGEIISIEGHQCKLGIEYVKEELFDPKRTLTTTIVVREGELPLVSVKTSNPIPKESMFQAMDCISQTRVNAPIEIGEVLLENVLGLNADIVATKRIKKIKKK
jgi:CxxC motif-containing protein